MAEYYLISQLPSLDGVGKNTPLPIDEARFLEICGQHLGKKAQREMAKLTIAPPVGEETVNSDLLRKWYDGERNLRLALAKIRGEKMNKAFDLKNRSLPTEMLKAASDAANEENPLRAETLLFEFRLKSLEALRPMDTFSQDFVFYYGLKLKLIMRMRQFNAKLGEDAYKDIYNSILNGSKTEEII